MCLCVYDDDVYNMRIRMHIVSQSHVQITAREFI